MKIKQYLEKIRKPNSKFSLRAKIFVSIALILSGFALGVFQKWLDSLAVNELPYILQAVDVTNFFGRPAVWIFIGTVIAVYASSSLRAGINCFLFFISMVSGYYLYCHFVLGFLPKSYMLIWIVFSFASFFMGYICWYAKGEGIVAIITAAGVTGVLFAQAFLFVRSFGITHILEIITWICALFVLRRKWKETLIVFALSLVVSFIYQLVIPYWG